MLNREIGFETHKAYIQVYNDGEGANTSSYTYGNIPSYVNAGVVCGYLNMAAELGQNVTLNVPYVGPGKEFGIVNATVGTNAQNSSWLAINYSSKANTSLDWKNWNITNTVKGATLYVTVSNKTQYLGQATKGNNSPYGYQGWQALTNNVGAQGTNVTYGSRTGF